MNYTTIKSTVFCALLLLFVFTSCNENSGETSKEGPVSKEQSDSQQTEPSGDSESMINISAERQAKNEAVKTEAQKLKEETLREMNQERSTVSSYRYVISSPEFSTFGKLVKSSKWAKAMHNDQITVFAPSNEAFEGYSENDIQAILKDQSRLDKFVGAHGCTTFVSAEKIDKIDDLSDLNGDRLIFNESGALRVQGVSAVRYDINTGNGNIIELKGTIGEL